MPVTTTRLLLKTPHSYGRDRSHPLPKFTRVKPLASVLALLSLVVALLSGVSTGALAQTPQTFYTAHAGGTGPPTPRQQPVNPNIFVNGYPCNGTTNGHAHRSSASGRKSRCRGTTRPSARPSRRPSPKRT